MDSVREKDKQLEKVIDRIDRKEKCLICRFVFLFAFIVFTLLILLLPFLRSHPKQVEPLVPLAPELAPPVSQEMFDQQMLDLGTTFHPELKQKKKVNSADANATTSKP